MNLDAGKFHGSGERKAKDAGDQSSLQRREGELWREQGPRETGAAGKPPAAARTDTGMEPSLRLPPAPVGGLQKGQQVSHGLQGPCSRNGVGLTFEDQPAGFPY